MRSDILIVSNSKDFTEETKCKILEIVEHAISSFKQVHIFREDKNLYDLLRDVAGVYYINGLSPTGGDTLLFNKMNEGFYVPGDTISKVEGDFSSIYKRAISRHVAPTMSTSYDRAEYDSRREAVMINRLRFAIANISASYSFIVNIQSSKEVNYLNAITPTFGDGKFIYTYNCLKNRGEFAVGGSYLTEDDMFRCIKEVR